MRNVINGVFDSKFSPGFFLGMDVFYDLKIFATEGAMSCKLTFHHDSGTCDVCSDYFTSIFVTKAFVRKYLKEKCVSKIFAKT